MLAEYGLPLSSTAIFVDMNSKPILADLDPAMLVEVIWNGD